jgi:hypothetical protein
MTILNAVFLDTAYEGAMTKLSILGAVDLAASAPIEGRRPSIAEWHDRRRPGER